MKHTPAPWKVNRSFSPARINKVDANKILVADCYASERTPEEQEANARLIAAAPELLELVLSAYDRFTDNDMQPANHALTEWLQNARAAIAKANA